MYSFFRGYFNINKFIIIFKIEISLLKYFLYLGLSTIALSILFVAYNVVEFFFEVKKTSPNVPKSNPNGNHMAPKWQFPITNQNDILIMSKTITYKSIADT